jgi:peptidoglycan/xylan/chitin deacetylase (PgdA/CDA1 family)
VLLTFGIVGGVAAYVATRGGGVRVGATATPHAVRVVPTAPAIVSPPRQDAPRRRIHLRARTEHERTLHLPVRLPDRSVELPILMYHRIDRFTRGMPAVTRVLTVTPGAFAGQMAWIAAHGFHTVTQLQVWRALMHGRPLPAHPVLVTFDDAYRDVVTYAAPVILRHHQHATAYVITNRLSHGRRTPWMTWPDLRLLERDGFDIGSHTVSHADLVAVGPARARIELRDSRRALEHYLHRPTQWLAYPYGQVDPVVEQLAIRAGYVLAVTTEGGTLQHADAPLLLDREEVSGTMGVAGLARLLSAAE